MDKETIIAVGGGTLLIILLLIAILRKINMASKEIWDIHPEVYHYTNFSTALLIIESANLRATRIDLLNDTEEITYAKKIISQQLCKEFPGASPEDAERDLEEIFYKAMGRIIYITSFCGKDSSLDPTHHANGLLSMWRSYGNDGGCAIIFKTKNIYDQTNKLRESLNETSPALLMDEVIYKGKNDADPEYCKRLSLFADNAAKFLKNREDRNSYDMGKIFINLLQLMLYTKHPAFFEEREVRIGLYFKTDIKKKAKIASSLPRFHSIPFSPDKDISRIIIGPHKDQQKRYESLKSDLSKLGLGNIEVTKSEIPLRT